MPANLASKNSAEKEKEKAFYNQIRKEREIRASSHSRPVSQISNDRTENPENEPEEEDYQEELLQSGKSDRAQEKSNQIENSPRTEPKEEENKENFYERQLRAAKKAAKDRIKKEVRKRIIQATKVAAKAFWRAVIVPVLSAIGTFLAATWYIWLILAVIIIIIVLGYAYGQEIWDEIPSWAQPAFETIINKFIEN